MVSPRRPDPIFGGLEEARIPTMFAIGMAASLVGTAVSITKVVAAAHSIVRGRHLRISSFFATALSSLRRLLHEGRSTTRTHNTEKEFSRCAPSRIHFWIGMV